MRMRTKCWYGNLKRKAWLDCKNVDGKMMLKWALKKQNMKLWTVVNVQGEVDVTSIAF
jgi:hypothetical protein